MWTRSELKENAREVLRTSYWKAFLVSLILCFAGGQGAKVNYKWPFSSGNGDGMSRSWLHFTGDGSGWGFLFTPLFITIVIIVAFIVLAFVFAFRIFLGFPLEVGCRRYYKQAAERDPNLNELGYSFGGGRYGPIVRAMLYRGVLNALWYLLLIIPGIVMSYAYSMVPYILADNPHIGAKRALELSRHMTDGHKGRMWVLDLSFIGWFILGTLALLVGTLFVLPYFNATQAELYLTLRTQALERGLCTAEELRMG
jgi:uncharacterized membrane protein